MHLTPISFFSLKRIYSLFEIFLRKNLLIRLNPRFSVPQRNLENSTKTPPFCFTTEFEGPAAIVTSTQEGWTSHVLSFTGRMVQYTCEKWAETPSRNAIGCCSNIPKLKKHLLYNLLAMIGQWYNKDMNDGLVLSNRNK